MRKVLGYLLVALGWGAFVHGAPAAEAQMRGDGPAPAPQGFRIERAAPGLDAVLSRNARLELLAEGFGLNEGPVWIADDGGYLLVASLIDNVIYKVTPAGEVTVFMEYAGYSGDSPESVGVQTRSGRAHVLLIGPGCAYLDGQGRLVWCAKNDRAVKRLEPDGRHTVLADGYRGRRFNGPNDLIVGSQGRIYLTDTDSGLRGGNLSPDKQLPNGVWLIQGGEVTPLLTTATLGGPPNGVALSPDEKYLYLSARPYLKRYEIRDDGTLGASIVFSEGEGIGDGIKVDRRGNVYSTSGSGPGVVRIVAPDGTHLGSLHLPILGGEPKKQICATNLAFGDADGRTLFITACDAVYRIRLNVEGIVPGRPG